MTAWCIIMCLSEHLILDVITVIKEYVIIEVLMTMVGSRITYYDDNTNKFVETSLILRLPPSQGGYFLTLPRFITWCNMTVVYGTHLMGVDCQVILDMMTYYTTIIKVVPVWCQHLFTMQDHVYMLGLVSGSGLLGKPLCLYRLEGDEWIWITEIVRVSCVHTVVFVECVYIIGQHKHQVIVQRWSSCLETVLVFDDPFQPCGFRMGTELIILAQNKIAMDTLTLRTHKINLRSIYTGFNVGSELYLQHLFKSDNKLVMTFHGVNYIAPSTDYFFVGSLPLTYFT